MADDRELGRLNAAEAWWALLARILSFFGGMAIMFFETIVENADRPWLIGAAMTMIGLPVANVIGKALDGKGG